MTEDIWSELTDGLEPASHNSFPCRHVLDDRVADIQDLEGDPVDKVDDEKNAKQPPSCTRGEERGVDPPWVLEDELNRLLPRRIATWCSSELHDFQSRPKYDSQKERIRRIACENENSNNNQGEVIALESNHVRVKERHTGVVESCH